MTVARPGKGGVISATTISTLDESRDVGQCVVAMGLIVPYLPFRDHLLSNRSSILDLFGRHGGIPIPHGAPNASAHVERLIGTLRRECLDRLLFWNERHLHRTLAEFIAWFNQGRAHQGLWGIPDPDPALAEPKPANGRLTAIPILNGLHHDYRLAA